MKAEFIKAMRKLVYPVSIVSTQKDGNKFAITVSSVTSVSIEPPSLLVCINRESSLAGALVDDGLLNINFLNPKQKSMASICSSKEKVTERFSNDQWSTDRNEIPYLRQSESVAFCKVATIVTHHTHLIVIADIQEMILAGLDKPNPLLYCNGDYLEI
jgi:flavin reductase (DIM6/NTAB) family NADH-FMN oxidoreductase RutF